MRIETVSSAQTQTIDRIVSIHMDTFQGFFLTFMGRGFLRSLYRSYAEHKDSGLLVAFEEDGPIGFLAYSADYSGLYRYMIKRRLISFAWYSLCAFLRRPAVFLRLIRALLKPGEAKREEEYVELASIGVAPESKSCGVGSRLVDALKDRVDFSRYAYITLETDAVDNEAANRFYKKNGFVPVRMFETAEGRKMYEYRYSV